MRIERVIPAISMFLCSMAMMAQPAITAIEAVNVQCPEGTAPRLPYRLWVKYSDGSAEYRQVRWSNSSLNEEKRLADAGQTPAGSSYEVRGFIIGDNSSTAGYPVMAHVTVKASADQVPSNVPAAEPLPLNKVILIGENRLTHNRDLDIDNLLALDVKQQLYNYRDTYGLSTEGYPKADGWDSPTTKLKGHGSGHYMSALAFAYASCPDAGKRRQLLERITLMVNQLRECQERTFVWDKELGRYREARDFAPEAELREMKGSWADFDRYKQEYASYGYGYINAIPAQHCVLIEMYRAYNNEQWVWAPYYSVHKQLAGLIDIANYVDDKKISKKALLIAKDMGLWVWNRMHYRTYVKNDGTQAERRSRPGNRYEMWNMYIAGEVGGMEESLSRLSEMVSDKQDKERLLEAANCFDSPAFFDPLARNIDAIRTRHANQHIPMVTGALRSFRSNAKPYYYNLAENFWTMVQGRYRYAMGGVGNGEMFRQPYTQMLSMCTNVTGDGRRNFYPEPTINETCCAYNLAKLTKDLNSFNPDKAAYMDYYERVLYNQIVGSVNPRHYATVYQYAVGLNASKPWGNETPQSTCCGGTGAENHVKYQEAAYFVSDNTIWVALYLPTEARWDAKKVSLRQECEWPAERTKITIGKGKARFAMKLRVPYWATKGFAVKLNGETVARDCRPGSYLTISERQWKEGDCVEVEMPFSLHLDFGPDKMEIAATGKNETHTPFEPLWLGAFMRGPLVLAATGIKNWQDAIVDVTGSASAADNGFAALASNPDVQILPDYDGNRGITHFFRLQMPGTPVAVDADSAEGVDVSALRELIAEAKSRRDAQNRWNEMSVKVPEYAPWARHGYERMMTQLAQAQSTLDNPDANTSQEAVNHAAAQLNAAINTMRPGNLPELEDMDELFQLMEKGRARATRTKALDEALEYGEMVIKYVSDGSGTMDMIEKATRRMKDCLR
ncbi:MAG: glycoside hydrolase family 127 protein [Bacteroidaceae bacterium]|nr:glycoside hydrolase family 127 protein [Bacteroidaceae bacterium]